jgi:beta-galactosidase
MDFRGEFRAIFPYLVLNVKLLTVKAAVFTNCDEVELWINGKKLGHRKPADFENRVIEWTFEYAPEEIKTIGYRDGKEVCSQTFKTATPPWRILLQLDKKILTAGGTDIAHGEVSIVDEADVLYPNEEALVEFALTGDGTILDTCSPDINSALGYALPKTFTSGGKEALVIVRAGAETGTLELISYSGTLVPAFLELSVIWPEVASMLRTAPSTGVPPPKRPRREAQGPPAPPYTWA